MLPHALAAPQGARVRRRAQGLVGDLEQAVGLDFLPESPDVLRVDYVRGAVVGGVKIPDRVPQEQIVEVPLNRHDLNRVPARHLRCAGGAQTGHPVRPLSGGVVFHFLVEPCNGAFLGASADPARAVAQLPVLYDRGRVCEPVLIPLGSEEVRVKGVAPGVQQIQLLLRLGFRLHRSAVRSVRHRQELVVQAEVLLESRVDILAQVVARAVVRRVVLAAVAAVEFDPVVPPVGHGVPHGPLETFDADPGCFAHPDVSVVQMRRHVALELLLRQVRRDLTSPELHHVAPVVHHLLDEARLGSDVRVAVEVVVRFGLPKLV